ncbi:6442_t:CDS:1 [Funneliformis geosporum]|uniref:17202_t:CDS:1 n=1 Tax=Funneliformis geosporum TaxID=1117311 RepID=A0A9W4X0Q0_9GLOM|nr:17202_t:CDS:1 [Funneliformis geosporum]CAI2186753.1 6442_t:CDS:1 [Funneliformis geosporum]
MSKKKDPINLSNKDFLKYMEGIEERAKKMHQIIIESNSSTTPLPRSQRMQPYSRNRVFSSKPQSRLKPVEFELGKNLTPKRKHSFQSSSPLTPDTPDQLTLGSPLQRSSAQVANQLSRQDSNFQQSTSHNSPVPVTPDDIDQFAQDELEIIRLFRY